MKALVYEGIKDVKVKNVGDPELKNADDIIVKVTSTAICGSDLHLIHGMVPNMPKGFVLGHEVVAPEQGRYKLIIFKEWILCWRKLINYHINW